MRHDFEETVLHYRAEQLEAWKAGDKSLLPEAAWVRHMVANQPAYHFGEAFVLRHFVERGWLGFDDYMIMPQVEPGIERHREGRETLERIARPERLRALRDVRAQSDDGRRGIGEPDLFLCKPTGEMLFVEVKKQGDRVKANQLVCLAQIREYLCCDAEIVYLQEVGRPARAVRKYSVTLESDGSAAVHS